LTDAGHTHPCWRRTHRDAAHPAMKQVVFRVDGDDSIGAGHVMRCVALAAACRNAGCHTHFMGQIAASALRERIVNDGHTASFRAGPCCEADDVAATLGYARATGEGSDCWVVLDGRSFGPNYQAAVLAAGLRLLVIDDMAAFPTYHAHLLLNQNLHAPELQYPVSAGTRLLLGCDYVLLRPEFLDWSSWQRTHPEQAEKVLVTLGGSVQENVATMVLRGISEIYCMHFDIHVLTGTGSSAAELHSALSPRHSAYDFRIDRFGNDMPALMASADLAIIGGGSTCWEAAFMGLPAATIGLAEDQYPITREMAVRGCTVDLGQHTHLTTDSIGSTVMRLARDRAARGAMSRQGRRLVDGRGAMRVVTAMLETNA
jgi:UDP-2,4-diacetamido-2,4,6-trideoxy-beta-L-altropyranose hydrolase